MRRSLLDTVTSYVGSTQFYPQRDQWPPKSEDGDADGQPSSILLASIEPLL